MLWEKMDTSLLLPAVCTSVPWEKTAKSKNLNPLNLFIDDNFYENAIYQKESNSTFDYKFKIEDFLAEFRKEAWIFQKKTCQKFSKSFFIIL